MFLLCLWYAVSWSSTSPPCNKHQLNIFFITFTFVFQLSLSWWNFHSCVITFHSIVSLVAVIYCIVIIYLPSLIEAETNYVVSFLLIPIKFYKWYHFLSFFYIISQFWVDKLHLWELYVALQGPKRCTTTKINRNITNAFQVKSTQSIWFKYNWKHMTRIENCLNISGEKLFAGGHPVHMGLLHRVVPQ